MASAESSSQYRWVTLSLLLLISMVTYLDRVNISIAGKYIMEDYGIAAVDMGKIFVIMHLTNYGEKHHNI